MKTTYTNLESVYNQSLSGLYRDIRHAKLLHRDQKAVSLAEQLVKAGKALDQEKMQNMLQQPFSGSVARDFNDNFYYTSNHVLGQQWADDSQKPLEQGELWNAGRRVTNTGVRYTCDKEGFPINPYANYGLSGRGMIGRYGPNHTVDNGILQVRTNAKGKKELCALGIIRSDNGLPALCGGFTNFTTNDNGYYVYDRKTIALNQTNEFFEELVSGSVELLPSYTGNLKQELSEMIAERERITGQASSAEEKNRVERELTTHCKLQQIVHEDPEFLRNVSSEFLHARDCYSGPVLSSTRNTNSAWMETRLSWFLLDDGKWETIKGDDKFDYSFKAGDDAQDVLWHPITPELVKNATGSNGAFFIYLLSAYLATSHEANPDILRDIKEQAEEMLNFLSQPHLLPQQTLSV